MESAEFAVALELKRDRMPLFRMSNDTPRQKPQTMGWIINEISIHTRVFRMTFDTILVELVFVPISGGQNDERYRA